jgi:hypothetical protein
MRLDGRECVGQMLVSRIYLDGLRDRIAFCNGAKCRRTRAQCEAGDTAVAVRCRKLSEPGCKKRQTGEDMEMSWNREARRVRDVKEA